MSDSNNSAVGFPCNGTGEGIHAVSNRREPGFLALSAEDEGLTPDIETALTAYLRERLETRSRGGAYPFLRA